jgi:hypothetical protein
MSRRLEFEERAAVLEFDASLPRLQAEALALAETYDRLSDVPVRANGILDELMIAAACRRTPEVAAALDELGLAGVRAPLWGVGCVVAEYGLWRPAGEGEPGVAALIVPACKEGRIVDLIAQSLADGRQLTRLGLVDLLGRDELEFARDRGEALLVFDDVLAWLRGDCRGSVILDWHRALRALDGLGMLLCSERIAPVLHRATRQCRLVPTIAVPQREEAGLAA